MHKVLIDPGSKLGQEIKMEAPKLDGIYLRGGFHNQCLLQLNQM